MARRTAAAAVAGSEPPRQEQDRGDRTPGAAVRRTGAQWTTTSSTTRPAICSPSATTSASAGATPATTTCWPPRRACAVSSPSRRDNCRRRLVRPRPPAHQRGRRAGAAVVERLDVRVPDAAAGDADLRRTRCSTRPARRRWSARSSTAGSAACRGASPNPATTRSTLQLNYQYRAFGVPGLGLKRGLADDLVVAPYASALALMVAPEAACPNLQRLAAEGCAGQYGFYEAIDYTPVAPAARATQRRRAVVHGPPPGHEPAVAGLRAAGPADAAALRVRPAVPGDRRCCCRSAFPRRTRRSTRTPPKLAAIARDRRRPGDAGARVQRPRHADARGAAAVQRPLSRDGHQRRRRLQPLEGPRRHPLARGRDLRQLGHVLLPPRRGRRRVLVDDAISRRSSAPTVTRRSSRRPGPSSAAATHDIETHTEIAVSPEDDIELRRLRITNRVRTRRTIEVTSYAEVVLAPPAADALHPAFSNCSCRPRSCATGRPSSARAGRARRASTRPGCST